MPLISNIMPIREALSGSLRESLDIIQQNLTDLKVMKIRLDQLGISPSQLVLALALITMGILTYYVAPISFLDGNLYLFLLILNFVIIFMILGLSFTAQLLLPIFEEWILVGLVTTFYRNSEKFKQIILKNLRNHRIRNSKTGMMFTVTLAFMIFGTCNFDNIGFLIKSGIREVVGSDISVLKLTDLDRHEGGEFYDPLEENIVYEGLNEQQLTQSLDQLQRQNLVYSYSFVTPEFKKFVEDTKESEYSGNYGFKLMNIKGDTIKPDIYGIDEHLLDSISQEFYYPVSENTNFEYDTIRTGQKNAVKTMFEVTNKNVSDWKVGSYDPKHILAHSINIDMNINIETFNLIIPESLKWLLSFDAGNNKLDTATL